MEVIRWCTKEGIHRVSCAHTVPIHGSLGVEVSSGNDLTYLGILINQILLLFASIIMLCGEVTGY